VLLSPANTGVMLQGAGLPGFIVRNVLFVSDEAGQPDAQALYDQLRGERRHRVTAGRAALFLAASDIVRARTDRAGGWLRAARAAGAPEQAVFYWLGRHAEETGDLAGALAAHLDAMLPDPSHPLAVAAAVRLAGPSLSPGARGRGIDCWRPRTSAVSSAPGCCSATRRRARGAARLHRLLAADRRAAPYVRLVSAPPPEWPIFGMVALTPEALLVSLGLASEAGPEVLRYFPPAQPPLLLAGARLLLAGGDPRRAIYAAEVLLQRVPPPVPRRALAEDFRRLLYPLPHAQAIHRESQRQAIDPHLLAAILREESRFDNHAVSPASARDWRSSPCPPRAASPPSSAGRRSPPRASPTPMSRWRSRRATWPTSAGISPARRRASSRPTTPARRRPACGAATASARKRRSTSPR
jgi:hypothetical protein